MTKQIKRAPDFSLVIFGLFALPAILLASSGLQGEAQPLQDPWGLYLKGELVAPERDNADQIGIAFGWPRRMETEVPMWGRSPAIVDIDQNGDWEIALVNGDGRLYVYQHDGALFPGFPTEMHRGNRPDYWEDPTHRTMVSIGDVDRDESADLVYGSDLGYLHVVGRNRHEPNPFPLDIGRGQEMSAVIALDVNGDHSSELIFTTYSVRPINDEEALLHVIDGSGHEFEGWPVRCGIGTGSSPAVGDIDNDGIAEIVVSSGRLEQRAGQIWAYHLDGTRSAGFPVGAYQSIGGSPILAELDGTPGLEIIFSAVPFDSSQAYIYALNRNGRNVAGFPVQTDEIHPFANPVVYGNEVDGIYTEILFGEFNANGGAKIWHISGVFGDTVRAEPLIEVGNGVVGSIVYADIMGDSHTPDIVAALAPDGDQPGRILIMDTEGEYEPYFIDLADYGGGAFASSPTLWDIDRDGHTEIIASTTDGRLYVWHTSGMFFGEMWPTERGDFTRSGKKMPYFERGIKDSGSLSEVPANWQSEIFPNPFNSSLTVSLLSPGSGRVAVELTDLMGRLVSKRSMSAEIGIPVKMSIESGNLGLTSGVYIVKWSLNEANIGSRSVIYLP